MDLYLVRILEKVDRLVCLRFEIGGRKLYKQITCDSHTVIHKNPNGWMKTSLLGTLLVRVSSSDKSLIFKLGKQSPE